MPISSITTSIIYVGLKTTEQIYHHSQESKMDDENVVYNPAYYLNLILEKLGLKEADIIDISSKLLNLAKNFSKIFPSLENLNRFNSFDDREVKQINENKMQEESSWMQPTLIF